MKRFLEHSKQQNLPCWSIAIFTGIIAIIGAAGCSADADNAAKSDHDRRAIAGQVVRHSYVCDDRSRVDLGSGLIDQSQKQNVAAMVMADMKVCAQRS